MSEEYNTFAEKYSDTVFYRNMYDYHIAQLRLQAALDKAKPKINLVRNNRIVKF